MSEHKCEWVEDDADWERLKCDGCGRSEFGTEKSPRSLTRR